MDFSLEQSIHLLARTPKVLWSQLEDLSPIWTQENYGPETWSVHDVIGHLIWGEKTDWIPRIRQILDPNQSNEFTPFDRDGHSDLCKERSFHQLLEMFEKLRNENLTVLRSWNLSSEQLTQTGVHPVFGEVTITQLIAAWTVHDLNHIAQINKAMAFQYYDAVGPWPQFLSILSPPNPR